MAEIVSSVGRTGEFDDVVVKKGSCPADGILKTQKSVRCDAWVACSNS